MKRLVCLVATLSALLATGSCSLMPGGEESMEVTAYFPDSAGLFVGNDVGVLGVPVGTIKEIKPDGDKVAVTMTVKGGVDIPADAGAVVTARSVATDRYVELTPVYQNGPKMRDNAKIGLERTRTPVDFDTVLATLSKFSKDIGGKKETARAIERFLKVGAEAFGGKGEQMNRSINALGEAVDAIAGQRDNIIGTMESLDVLTKALAANQETIRAFSSSVAQATKLLADERGNLRTALNRMQTSIAVVSTFVRENREELLGSINKLSDVIGIIMKSERDLKEMVETFALPLQNLERARAADGKVRVRMSPVYLTPIGGELQELCQTLKICDIFNNDNPLGDLLEGILP